MTNNEILHADLLDILFEHRNKRYGAYALRKEYNNRLGIALAVALSLVLLLIVSSFMKKSNRSSSAAYNGADTIELKILKPPAEPESPRDIPKEKIKQVKSVDKIQLVQDDVPADMPEQPDMVDAIVGKENIDSKPLTNPDSNLQPTPADNGQKKDEDRDVTMTIARKEIPPSFPGGINEWLSFLRRNLQTPDELSEGQKVVVRVRFWIDTDGSVSRFEIVQSGGSLFDKEVLRVMRKMPRWEPATQNNLKVAVSYIQPVIFVGVEE